MMSGLSKDFSLFGIHIFQKLFDLKSYFLIGQQVDILIIEKLREGKDKYNTAKEAINNTN